MALSFKKQFLHYLIILFPLSIALGAIQYGVISYMYPTFNLYLSTWSIYTFHFCLTCTILIALIGVSKVAYDKVGFAFVACSLLKMFASVLFLVPLIKASIPSKIPDAFAFFIPYFIFLAIETYFTLRLLRTGENAKNES